MLFELHPDLASKVFVLDLPLCRVLMEDERRYPWIFLVPRRPQLSRLMDLTVEDQRVVFEELDLAQRVLWSEFDPWQINVAAIGNKTPQLHLHVIARYRNDPAWPNTVWDHPARTPYSAEERLSAVHRLRVGFALAKSAKVVSLQVE